MTNRRLKHTANWGIWRYGVWWMRPLVASAPFLSILILLLMFYFMGGALSSAKGVMFDLPSGDVADSDVTDLTVLVVPMRDETLVFFDDSRYILRDNNSVNIFCEHLQRRLSNSNSRTMLVLADRRVSGGELMDFASIAKKCGVRRLLFAEKKSEQM